MAPAPDWTLVSLLLGQEHRTRFPLSFRQGLWESWDWADSQLWRSEDSFRESILSTWQCGLWVPNSGHQALCCVVCLYSLSHITRTLRARVNGTRVSQSLPRKLGGLLVSVDLGTQTQDRKCITGVKDGTTWPSNLIIDWSSSNFKVKQ